MTKENSFHDLDSLKENALKIIALRDKVKNLMIVNSTKDVVPSTGLFIFRFYAVRKKHPNGPHYNAVLDDTGKVVDYKALSKREGKEFFQPALLDAHTYAVSPIPSTGGPITIDPSSNDLSLDHGDTLKETITVEVPRNHIVPKADIYFLADTTGSMEPIIAAVKSGISSILGSPSLSGIDIAFAVGNYKDFPNDPYAFIHQLTPTTNGADVAGAINEWNASGGGDGPEGQLFALDQIASSLSSSPSWRQASKRIIVWLGDAPAHDPICKAISGLSYDITEASVTGKLIAEKILVIAISTVTGYSKGLDDDPITTSTGYRRKCVVAGSANQATRISRATGGLHKSGIDPTNIVKTIIDLIAAIPRKIKNLKLVRTGATVAFVTSLSPSEGYGPLIDDRNHVLKFDVSFSGVVPCSNRSQFFNGTLDVVTDGAVAASKQVRVTVPLSKTGKRFVYEVKFVCGIQEECKCEDTNFRSSSSTIVGPGAYSTEINIHNYQDSEAHIVKNVLPVVFAGAQTGREPRFVQSKAKESMVLPPKSATMDDCVRILQLLLGTEPTGKVPLTVGFLEITSPVELSVSAVYTLTDLKKGRPLIHVEYIAARLVRSEV